MKNFARRIHTYNGDYLRYNELLSTTSVKVYTNKDYRLSIVAQPAGRSYTIEVASIINVTDVHVDFCFTVRSRRGVYSVLTFFEYLYNNDEVEFLNNQYGSLQHYFDDVCCTSEFLKEHYNM